MKRIAILAIVPVVLAVLLVGTATSQSSTMFTVSIENVSQPGTIDTERAGGANPLSPGPYAVFTGENPVFTPGASADQGTELVAEDGFAMMKADALAGAANVSASGVFTSEGGPDSGPAIFPGETATFTFVAAPGDRLSLETMFVQSNDWFYADDGSGIALFDGDGNPISGDLTNMFSVWDAGTEADTAPGTGPDQKPAQDPEAMDQGPKEDEPIALAADRHPDFTVPAVDAVMRVTITAQGSPNPPGTGTGLAAGSDGFGSPLTIAVAGLAIVAVVAGSTLAARRWVAN